MPAYLIPKEIATIERVNYLTVLKRLRAGYYQRANGGGKSGKSWRVLTSAFKRQTGLTDEEITDALATKGAK